MEGNILSVICRERLSRQNSHCSSGVESARLKHILCRNYAFYIPVISVTRKNRNRPGFHQFCCPFPENITPFIYIAAQYHQRMWIIFAGLLENDFVGFSPAPYFLRMNSVSIQIFFAAVKNIFSFLHGIGHIQEYDLV